MGHVEGGIMDEDAQAHIRARSHLQSGSAQDCMRSKISRVEVFEDDSTLTTGGRMAWTGKAGRILHDS